MFAFDRLICTGTQIKARLTTGAHIKKRIMVGNQIKDRLTTGTHVKTRTAIGTQMKMRITIGAQIKTKRITTGSQIKKPTAFNPCIGITYGLLKRTFNIPF